MGGLGWWGVGVLFWHARGGGHLTCAVTPAAPHVLQLGKLHSARLSGGEACRVEWLQSHPRKAGAGLGGPEPAQPMFFLKKLSPPSCRCVLNSPPRVLFLHDTWTYDSSALGLSFNVCQGESSQCTHMAGRSRAQRACRDKVQRSREGGLFLFLVLA